MARGSAGRVEAITRADARARLKTARMYLTAAELIVDEAADEAATVATGNAVLAGIAAADAICAYASGDRCRGPDHRATADHLERVTGDKTLGRCAEPCGSSRTALNRGCPALVGVQISPTRSLRVPGSLASRGDPARARGSAPSRARPARCARRAGFLARRTARGYPYFRP